jgi:Rrf2 family protein
MLNLAQRYANGNVAVILKNVSTEEDISIRYLEQIIIPLKINKLVKSIRGAGGGYTLSRPPSQITVCDILKALEGSCALVDCIEDEGYCDRLSTCASFEIWKEASNILKKYFESVTLQDLIEIAKKKQRKVKDKARTKAH